jgi:hypothetical protein
MLLRPPVALVCAGSCAHNARSASSVLRDRRSLVEYVESGLQLQIIASPIASLRALSNARRSSAMSIPIGGRERLIELLTE